MFLLAGGYLGPGTGAIPLILANIVFIKLQARFSKRLGIVASYDEREMPHGTDGDVLFGDYFGCAVERVLIDKPQSNQIAQFSDCSA
jgi:hypothetical protein